MLRTSAFAATLLLLAADVRADTVILTTGDRIEGQVVSETDQQVSIRRRFRDTGILYVQNIPRSRIVRIDRTPAEPELDATATLPADLGTADFTAETGSTISEADAVKGWLDGQPPPAQIKNPRQFMLNAIERWQQEQYPRAAADLTRLCSLVHAAELDAISPECERRVGISLARLAAEAHWKMARSRSKAGPLRFTGVTVYELPALVPMIIEAYRAAIYDEISLTPAPAPASPSTRPAKPHAQAAPRDHVAAAPRGGREVKGPPNHVTAAPPGDHVAAPPHGDHVAAAPRGGREQAELHNHSSHDNTDAKTAPAPGGREIPEHQAILLPDAQIGLADAAPAAPDATEQTRDLERQHPFAAPGKPDAPRLTIHQWLERPNELNVSRSQAAALAERTVYANSLLNERIRLDPAVRRDRTLQSALIGQRIQLIALLRSASELATGSGQVEQAAQRERRRQALEADRQRVMEQRRREQQQHQSLVREALRLAQEQARQQAAAAQSSAAGQAPAPAPDAPDAPPAGATASPQPSSNN